MPLPSPPADWNPLPAATGQLFAFEVFDRTGARAIIEARIVTGPEAELPVFLNVWRLNYGLPPLLPEELETQTEILFVHLREGRFADATGHDSASGEPVRGMFLLAPLGDRLYAASLIGDPGVVHDHQAAFRGFIADYPIPDSGS